MLAKISKIAAAVLLLFSLAATSMSAASVSAAAKTVKIKVTLVSMKLVDNDHVGNEWFSEGYVNGKAIKEGSSVTLTLKPADSIQLKAYAEEQDKVPDIGSKQMAVKASSVTKSLNKSLSVIVTENRGRYSGNTAKWVFSFKLQKQ